MKKTLSILTIITLFAFTMPQKPKVYTVKGSTEQFNALMHCLDKSNASHTTVTAVQQWLQQELQPQIADTTKK